MKFPFLILMLIFYFPSFVWGECKEASHFLEEIYGEIYSCGVFAQQQKNCETIVKTRVEKVKNDIKKGIVKDFYCQNVNEDSIITELKNTQKNCLLSLENYKNNIQQMNLELTKKDSLVNACGT